MSPFERVGHGLPPFGYTKGSDGKLEFVPSEAKVGLAFEKYATGMYSDADVAALLNKAGLRARPYGQARGKERPFTKHTIRSMLKNPFYTGMVAYRGKGTRKRGEPRFLTEGQHDAIVSSEAFERIQRTRDARCTRRKASANYDTAVYPAADLLRCAKCNTRLRGGKLRGQRNYVDPPSQRISDRLQPVDVAQRRRD